MDDPDDETFHPTTNSRQRTKPTRDRTRLDDAQAARSTSRVRQRALSSVATFPGRVRYYYWVTEYKGLDTGSTTGSICTSDISFSVPSRTLPCKHLCSLRGPSPSTVLALARSPDWKGGRS